MSSHRSTIRVAVPLVALFLACSAAAVALFPRAFPLLFLEQNLTPGRALAVADSFAVAHALPRTQERTAVRFEGDDGVQTYLDLEGGADSVAAVVRGRDHALYTWSVRRFAPGDAHETRVTLWPDGRVLGFERRLADSTRRPNLAADSALHLAEMVRSTWLEESSDRWRMVTSSYDTKAGSGRVDRTFTFERMDRQLLAAPLRLAVTIGGDLPTAARRVAAVPEAFQRRYREMRSANEQLAMFASAGAFLLMIGALLVLRHFSGTGEIRWRESWIVGGVVGGLAFAAALNQLPLEWFDYDTATSAGLFRASTAAAAIFLGVVTALQLALTLAAADVASRRAFPRQPTWWRWWAARGTRQVAGRVLAGYALAAVGLAYVAVFYLVTRRTLGWWVPTELVDNPNLMATRAPWLAGVAMALEAGVWEEALFRVLPLSLLSLWVGNRPGRTRWMALGVVTTALVFGFAHANYASWPAYSRGVEIFLDACLWGALVVWLGPLPTMLGHFLYDLILFGLFAAAGTAPAYRFAATMIALVALLPALAVIVKWWRQRGLSEASEADLGSGVIAVAPVAPSVDAPAIRVGTLSTRAQRLAMLLGACGLAFTLAAPSRPTRGARPTAGRARVMTIADSALTARGVRVAEWTRLARTVSDTLDAWERFLHREHAEHFATALATSYAPPAWWIVRFVRPHGAVDARAEEWRVRVLPDGRLLDVRHLLPDATWRDSVSADSARVVARGALHAAGIDASRLVESRLTTDRRAGARGARQRVDTRIFFTDTTVHLPGDALARVRVDLAGPDLVLARRAVELPESFLRSDAQRQTTRSMVSAVGVVGIGAIVIGGIFWTRRRRAVQRRDQLFNRRRALGTLGVLAALRLLDAANELPLALAGYDTAQPWGRFLAGVAMQGVMSLVVVGLLAALWMLFDGMRRRAGIPLFTLGADAWRSTALAGLGLAGAQATVGRVVGLLVQPRIPGVASPRGLDTFVPPLDGALGLGLSLLTAVLVIGIIACVILLLARSTAARVALLMLFGALATLVVAGVAADDVAVPHRMLLAAVCAASLPFGYLALRTWARTSVVTWVVAVILATAIDTCGALVRATGPVALWTATVTLATCAVFLALAQRLTMRWREVVG